MRSPPVTLVPYLLDGGIELHPIAARYFLQPSGDDADLQRIALSIQKQGTIEPVITYESMLLDGQVRDKSNIEHGLPRWAIRFEDTPMGSSPLKRGLRRLWTEPRSSMPSPRT